MICLSGLGVCSKDHDNFCTDLTDYGKLYYKKINVTVCNTAVEKVCKPVEVAECMEVPEINCEVCILRFLHIFCQNLCRWNSSKNAYLPRRITR